MDNTTIPPACPDGYGLNLDPDLELYFPNQAKSKVIKKGQPRDDDKMLRQTINDLVKTSPKHGVEYEMSKVPQYPDLKTFSSLAHRAYKDDDGKTHTLPDGWTLIATAANHHTANGYFGAAFMHPEHRQIVIAHRGTKLSKFGAFLADIAVLKNKMHPQMDSACTFSHKVGSIVTKIEKTLGCSIQLHVTGHSLGGWLGQITAFSMKYLDIVESTFQKSMKANEKGGIHVHTVIFDSPGCKQMLSILEGKYDVRQEGKTISVEQLDISTYLSAPNYINTCKPHAGTLYRIEMDFSNFNYAEKHTMKYTITTHSMSRILNALKNDSGINIVLIVDWPIVSIGKKFKISWKKYGSASTILPKKDDEWKNFFEWAEFQNNYCPDVNKLEAEVKKNYGYHIIRYQATPRNEKRCKMNVFNKCEQDFLQTFCLSSPTNRVKDLFPEVLPQHQECLENNFKDFKIEKGYIAHENLQLFIPYVKQLVHFNTQILSELSAYGMRKNILDKENLWFVHSVKRLRLDYKKDIELDQNSGHQVRQVIVENANEIRMITSKFHFYYTQSETNKSMCTMLKLKQMLHIDKEKFKFKDFLEHKEVTEHLFIIECQSEGGSYNAACSLFRSILNVMKEKKYVRFFFISLKEDMLTGLITKEFNELLGEPFQETKHNRICWADLTQKCYEMLWKKKLFFLEDKYNKQSLEDLVKVPSEFIKETKHTSTLLHKLINDEEILVGKEQQHLFQLNAAFANMYQAIDKKQLAHALRSSDENTNFVFASSTKREDMLEYLGLPGNDKDLSKKIVLIAGKDAETNNQQWKEQCSRYSYRTMYWIDMSSQQIHCKQVYDPGFYVKRQFECEVEGQHTEQMYLDEDGLIEHPDRVFIITGEPGMGKSNTLMRLALQMRSRWVTSKQLRYCSDAITSLPSDSAITEDHVVQFLVTASKNVWETDLETAFLRYGLQGKTKTTMHLLFDGFDEINKTERDQMVALLKFLKDNCKCYAWITSRKHVKEELETSLQVSAINLTEIGRKEQEAYLEKFWNAHLVFKLNQDNVMGSKVPGYTIKILDKASTILGSENSSFISVPMQLRMIAETFIPYDSFDDREIYMYSKGDLYDKFIQRKYDIYFKEKVGFISSSGIVLENWFTPYLNKVHCVLACRLLFDRAADEYLCNSTADDCNSDLHSIYSVGLILPLIRGNYAFVHSTFAEYFVAKLIAHWLYKPKGRNRQIEKFLFSPILKELQWKGIRSHLNGMLKKKNNKY